MGLQHLTLAAAFFMLVQGPVHAADREAYPKDKLPLLQNVITLDGKYVHTVGNLQMNITNWGFLGSLPNSQFPMSDVPSAQWPAGSGIEYLYASGLWVGAKVNGIPVVSTGYPETEFFPTKDPLDVIYETFEGDFGGDRYPTFPDDDRDDLVDEDWLNRRDDDGDGKIDEDFAATSKQMFYCKYTDDQDQARIIWPEHTPLNVEVTQETYQWAEELYEDFIGVHYTIRNTGNNFLESVILGIYADVDAGPRTYGTYHMDDMIGYYSGIQCAKRGDVELPVQVEVAYVYDNDGDDGQTPGYFGIVVLGHSMDFDGVYAPWPPFLSIISFNIFQGLQPFINGGDPTNDYERYKMLSTYHRSSATEYANDYRMLLGIGPFYILPPGGRIELHIAFVCGDGLDEMLANAANAVFVFRGAWFDKDMDTMTGIDGRETLVEGPLKQYDPDPCDGIEEKLDLAKFETVWSNLDCMEEQMAFRYSGCYKGPSILLRDFQTGIVGKEYNVHWLTGSAPPPPRMRVHEGDHMISVLWDNLSEVTPDFLTLQIDFEGYEVWRADNWTRPLGTTFESGPSRELWRLIASRDVMNNIPPNVDFEKPEADGGWIYEPLVRIDEKEQLIKMFEESIWYAPLDTVPCPPGLTDDECDTLEAVARYNLGFEGGRRYYRYIDREAKNGMHYFYSVVSYDHELINGVPAGIGRFSSPSANFVYTTPISAAQTAEEYDKKQIYVVPNPATTESMQDWTLHASNDDPSGLKVEFRNLPECRSTVRVYTVAGDLVQTLHHDGREGNGTVQWNLVSRNGQNITSGVYLFSVEPEDGRFDRAIGKFVIIR
ncbi:MAG: hypothetical protein KAX13_03425 [Candidatus Krumholzibacteria bacterium]|nr:hypothetical protein [Candidatus Krumholzibacteria bacterium]